MSSVPLTSEWYEIEEDIRDQGEGVSNNLGFEKKPIWYKKNLERKILEKTRKEIEKESPFSTLDDFQDEKTKLQRLLNHIRTLLNAPYGIRLASRINDLIKELYKEEPDNPHLSVESLRRFVSFIQNNPNLKYPEITITPSGDIFAQWRASKNRLFNAYFLPNGEVKFLVFTPNRFELGKRNQIAGLTTVELLLETIKPFNVLTWISNER